MKAVILQSNYIPWKGYFDLMNMADIFIFYDDGQFTKNDWRNRNTIKTHQGLLRLTIPMKYENSKQKILDKHTCGNSWRRKHWRSISIAYSKSRYFKQYSSLFEALYLGCSETSLSNINYSFIKTVNELLGINTPLYWSSDFILKESKTERLIDLCRQVGATEYISGPAGKNYIQEILFNEAGLKITWMDYNDYSEYNQRFTPFEHSVSILDLIFNEGPESFKYMKSFSSRT